MRTTALLLAAALAAAAGPAAAFDPARVDAAPAARPDPARIDRARELRHARPCCVAPSAWAARWRPANAQAGRRRGTSTAAAWNCSIGPTASCTRTGTVSTRRRASATAPHGRRPSGCIAKASAWPRSPR
jgi:hypothetical protein